MNSGTFILASPAVEPEEPLPSAAAECVAHAVAIATHISKAPDEAAILQLLHEGMQAVGADSAVFISFVRDDQEFSACRFLLACDPLWCQHYLAKSLPAIDPWLSYATHRSEPTLASEVTPASLEQSQVVALAAEHGFRSTVLAPAHSTIGHSRISLLCLGSSSPGHYEQEGLSHVRICARILALELHDWWIAKIRRGLLIRSRVNADDLMLLRAERHGHSSKRIASDLDVSVSSINSRFQRLNAKLGVDNRRLAAKLAAECGLIIE